ncbi:sulfatase-like hydrolase/transferase [Phycisphaera mikurensis]|uniref:Putative sulfatase n=1 Tax=Phycisphaera mikurensis (strain NBRC 102666 / KCTC 22515 / FYK2301M01) TaxID=1142394 RepID=I0IDF0_PHYMF|nr:sulfatase-like hydrolase/transferase [Phycisphaera mikurensis]MBB6443326.1 arylsulfatase A-like enzyme [Phycisphaera mikurensis]BAM03288.1 putative sulfatase [Phycisphaera mikurensis NBRC 102666]
MSGRLNVVVFFTDQQRHDTSGLHGCPLDLTPNLDAWGARGTHFAQAITPQPVCGPARACLQTGRFATAIGPGCHTNGRPLPAEADTLAKRFAAAGYATGYFGKWHLAGGGDAVPEESRGGWQHWLAANALEATSDAYQTRLWDAGGHPVDLPGYRVDALTDATIRWISERSGAGEPFLCMLSHLEPHMQNHRDDHPAPAFSAGRYAGRWTPPDLAALPGAHPAVRHLTGGNAQQQLAGYFGMCRRLDEAFGRLMDALISLGRIEDTVVLFASDHACHFRTRNDEYKRSCHEASVRTPCVAHGGPFTGGGRVELPFQLTDVAPTLCGAAGVDPPEGAQGRSAVGLVRREPGAAAAWPEEAFIQVSESVTGRAVRTRRWKYAAEAPDAAPGDRFAAAYTETHLYDLLADPHELINLAGLAAYAPVRERMKERLLRRMAAAGEPAAEVRDAAPPDPMPPQHAQRELRAADDRVPLG